MMWHVYQQARKAKSLDGVLIATDDERIRKSCEILDLPVMMTRSDHVSGTDRVAECATRLDNDIFVNIQGDEPMIDPEAVDAVANALASCDDDRVVASNAWNYIGGTSDAIDTNVVKVLVGSNARALAYSRLPVPYPKTGTVVHRRQFGLYAFRRKGLKLFSELEPGELERAEGVEMYRFVEHGHDVLMVQVADDPAVPVDTRADLERVRSLMKPA